MQPNHQNRSVVASEIRIVEAWHEALNGGDTDRLVSLSHKDIEIGGLRGTARGTKVLQEWVDRANISLEPLRVFYQDDTLFVQQAAEWRSAEAEEVIGSQTVASVFVVREDQVTSVSRYDGLDNALQKANLDESQEVQRLTSY